MVAAGPPRQPVSGLIRARLPDAQADLFGLELTHLNEPLARSFKKFAEDAMARLQTRAWPGNIRELRNAVERALILAPGKVVTAADIDRLLPGGDGAIPLPSAPGGAHTFETFKQEAEKNFLVQQLRDHDWNVSETARALKMPRSNLYKKIERYGLTREST